MKICQEPPIHWDEEIYLFFFYMLLSFRSKINTFMGLRDISKFLTKWLLAVSVLTPACVYKNSFYHSHTCAAKSLQSCPTLCDPIDGSPPGSPVPGVLQARTLEWVAISFSNAGKWKVKSEVAQSCPTPSSSSVHGVFQARVLEWGAIAFSDSHTCTGH